MAIVDQINRLTGQNVGGSIEDALRMLEPNGSGSGNGNNSGSSVTEVVPEFTTIIYDPTDPTFTAVVTCDLTVEELYDGIVDGSIKRAAVNVFVGDTLFGQVRTTYCSANRSPVTGEIGVVFRFSQVMPAGTPLTTMTVGGNYLEGQHDYFWQLPAEVNDAPE